MDRRAAVGTAAAIILVILWNIIHVSVVPWRDELQTERRIVEAHVMESMLLLSSQSSPSSSSNATPFLALNRPINSTTVAATATLKPIVNNSTAKDVSQVDELSLSLPSSSLPREDNVNSSPSTADAPTPLPPQDFAAAACRSDGTSSNDTKTRGLIVGSLLGRMGNNLFQVALANRLAEQLCWPVVFRPSWQGPLAHDDRLRQCFPDAFAYASAAATNYSHLDPALRDAFRLTHRDWETMQRVRNNPQFNEWRDRVRASKPTHWWYELDDNNAHGAVDKGQFIDHFVRAIQNGTMPTRVIHVRGFFIHYDYVKHWLPRMRIWNAVDAQCCQTVPQRSDTIVLHWRDFNQADGRQFATPDTNWVQAYVDLLAHHGWLGQRPLWILTQPSSARFPDVQRLAQRTNATVHTGADVPDAMCLLQQHASTVLLSYASTFSQGPVLFGRANVSVHYPLVKLRKPAVTVPVPFWHYHLVEKSGVARFHVSYNEIQL